MPRGDAQHTIPRSARQGQRISGPGPDAVELALELADYCELEGVTAALTRRRSGDVPFDEWIQVVNEIQTCVRWHD